MEPFDVLGPLPEGTTVLEASAGTGKTYAVGALVARYVAEGRARLEEMLVITFGRAASQELRERVRDQLVEAERAMVDPSVARSCDGLVGLLADVPDEEVARRQRRLADALASFDAATIATTHQFCQLVLRSLGVAGDTDQGARLVENLLDLVREVVDDLYLQRFGGTGTPAFDRADALTLAAQVVDDPQARLTPDHPEDELAAARVAFAADVRREVERRKRRLGILSYDDLLSRLADALEAADSPARERMRARWKVVLVDEFQDTDPVQWAVLDRAFTGHATMVLIGDPKQAIYAFRGGDIFSYLAARETAGTLRTLATNWRSDAPLVGALQALTHGVQLGDERIVVHDVAASPDHQHSRLSDAPAPFRLRLVRGADLGTGSSGTVAIDALRRHIAADLAADVARLLASGATYDGRPVAAGDVAILMFSLRHVQCFRDELAARGIPSVVTTGTNVLTSRAGDEWVTLLEALEQPARAGRVRSVALTSFGGHVPADLGAPDAEELTDDLAERLRGWLDLFRTRGVAAVFEAVAADGLAARVLAQPDGERLLTDLQHLAQLLHEAAHRGRLGLPALLEWLRTERADAVKGTERPRRLDTDAAAVQIMTVHGSKGLQFPVVHLPLLFNQWIADRSATELFHDEHGVRCREVAGSAAAVRRARAEDAAEELRLTYVALTRAQSQVVAWWAPSWDAGNAGLTRLLLGRSPGSTTAPDVVRRGPSDQEVLTALQAWQAAGAISLEVSEPATAVAPVLRPAPPRLGVRSFDRTVDTDWRRTSYSGLIRAEEQLAGVALESEPEVAGTVDEDEPEEGLAAPEPTPDAEHPDDLPSPMAALPAGAGLGSLVHAVLEHADPQAPDLAAELLRRTREQLRWWPVDAPAETIAEALLPMQTTSLGPLADGLRLVDLGRRDRLCELDFEFPLVGGDRRVGPTVRLGDVAGLLRQHLAADDPMRAYADRLLSPSLGEQVLRGYLSGSIDVVLRVPDAAAGHRYLVVDYKTNLLGERDRPLTALDYRPEAVTAAMLHSHYPLQALLYSVVLHRYLRWRQPGYDPQRHLGGILYLYVRGMCGPDTPEVGGQPCGVFSWKPPAALVTALSDLLDGAREESA